MDPKSFSDWGINGKASELNAAMGLAVLPYFTEIIGGRKQICETYDSLLEDANIKKVKFREEIEWNYSYYPIILPSEEILLKIKGKLNKIDIFPRRYFYPSLNSLCYLDYKKKYIAEKISKKILCLPLFLGIDHKLIKKICSTIKE